MKIGYYNSLPEEDPVDASVHKFIMKLKKKNPDLFSFVMKVLREVEKSDSLEVFIKQEIVAPLSNPLWEFRIPKKKAGGVVRLYFCYVPNRYGEIQILDCEVKRGRTKPDQDVLKRALKRYKELFK